MPVFNLDCENRITASKCLHSKPDRGTVCLKPLHGIAFLGLAAWMNTSQAMGHSRRSWVFSCHCFLAFLYLVFSKFLRDPALSKGLRQSSCVGFTACQPPVGINRKSHTKQGLLFPGMDAHCPGHTTAEEREAAAVVNSNHLAPPPALF